MSIQGTTHTGYLSKEHPVCSVKLLNIPTEFDYISSYLQKDFTEFLSHDTSD